MKDNSPQVKDSHYMVHAGAYTVGHYAARIFFSRGEIAHNPFIINSIYWYSFNLGARESLIKLGNQIVQP